MTTVAISLKDEDRLRHTRFDELRAKVQVGIEQADHGDFVEFTAEDVKRDGRQRLAAQQTGH